VRLVPGACGDIFAWLETRGFEVLLVEPQQVHRLTGRPKSAGHDWQGIDDTTAFMIVREMGMDMGRWPPVQHFTSWLGVCPHPQVSGGKVLSRGTKPSANLVATALRLTASGLHHRRSARGAFFRRMKARWGTPQAITATAHGWSRTYPGARKSWATRWSKRRRTFRPSSHSGRTVPWKTWVLAASGGCRGPRDDFPDVLTRKSPRLFRLTPSRVARPQGQDTSPGSSCRAALTGWRGPRSLS
jgi:hypothetical protein